MQKEFDNPYRADIDGGAETTKISTIIPKSAYNNVAGIRLTNGTIRFTLAILWNKLENELKRRGITNFNHIGQYEELLLNSRLCLPGETCSGGDEPGGRDLHGRAVALPHGQPIVGDVGRGTPSQDRAATSEADSRPDNESSPRRGSGRRTKGSGASA
jgi:hypothetical protein